jgi:hypothetical protein
MYPSAQRAVMASRIFDRETLLDLVVNAVPLFIMAFFVAAFAVFAPFGFDPLASGLQFALVIVPFLLLLVLTYFSARAIAGAELAGPTFLPGQTTPPEAEPLGGHGGETAAEGDEGASDADEDEAGGADDEADETDDGA